MQIPLECSFANVEASDEIENLIREKVDLLERHHPAITSCRIHVRAPHTRHQKGNLYDVSIVVRVSGADVSVHPQKGDAPEHEHLPVAIRDAFAAMAKRLESHKQKSRGDVKQHEGMLQGKVAEISYSKGFGQILATDHRLIYFHKNSVVDGVFENLNEGDAVELVVETEESGTGPQASTVRPIGPLKHVPD